jgi:hypothetical protein
MTLERKLAKFLGYPSWRRECPLQGPIPTQFPLFEADGRVWEFERPSLSTGQKFSLKSERVIFQHELIRLLESIYAEAKACGYKIYIASDIIVLYHHWMGPKI